MISKDSVSINHDDFNIMLKTIILHAIITNNNITLVIINELMTNAIKHTAVGDAKHILVNMKVHAYRVTIVIENEIDSLPDDFDFSAGVGLGTGLTLIRSLLPSKGAELTIKPEQKRMLAVLTLWAPVVRNEHE